LLGGFDYGYRLGSLDHAVIYCIYTRDCKEMYRMLLFFAVTVAVAAFIFTSDARRQFW